MIHNSTTQYILAPGRIGYPGYFEISGSGSGLAGSVKLLSGSGFGLSGYPGLGYPD